MKKRPKPQRRVRQTFERTVHRNRLHAGRVYRVWPDPSHRCVVEVRIARDARRMRDLMNFHDGQACFNECERNVAGLVRTWHWRRGRRSAVLRPRGLLARMYLNVRDLRGRPNEIVSHECTHAAMAYARLVGANLSVMPGEEVLAHAVGRLTKQVIRICFAAGVWPR